MLLFPRQRALNSKEFTGLSFSETDFAMNGRINWISNGDSFSFGSFPEIINRVNPQRAFSGGEIWLPLGDFTMGLTHILKHEKRIAHLHRGMNALDYVASVCSGYSEIYFQSRRNTFMLKKYNGINSAIVAVHSAGIYQIITAFPITRDINHKGRNEELIWRK